MEAAFVEREPRARDEVTNHTRDQHFARVAGRHHACAGVNGDAGEVVAVALALAGVDSGSHLDPQRRERIADRERAAHRTGWAVEGGEKAVAGRSFLAAAEAL